MAVKMRKEGYGQLEPNRISAQKTKQIFGQLPLDEAITLCEQGMCLVYDEVAGKVVLPAAEGDYACLVWNEFILEDERYQMDKDYAMMNFAETEHQVALKGHPRLMGLTLNDTFITNTVELDSEDAPVSPGDLFTTGVNGYWVKASDPENAKILLKVVRDFTMPDLQRGIQFVVVAA